MMSRHGSPLNDGSAGGEVTETIAPVSCPCGRLFAADGRSAGWHRRTADRLVVRTGQVPPGHRMAGAAVSSAHPRLAEVVNPAIAYLARSAIAIQHLAADCSRPSPAAEVTRLY